MSQKLTAVITKEENWYVAHCLELGVVSQGKTIEETQANLREAVELYLEGFGEVVDKKTSG
jgi:predicted RNase H-like HicB family nuclease